MSTVGRQLTDYRPTLCQQTVGRPIGRPMGAKVHLSEIFHLTQYQWLLEASDIIILPLCSSTECTDSGWGGCGEGMEDKLLDAMAHLQVTPPPPPLHPLQAFHATPLPPPP